MSASSVVIKIGATAWGATIYTPSGPLEFDFSKMTREQRREFRKEFVAAFRQTTSKRIRTRRER